MPVEDAAAPLRAVVPVRATARAAVEEAVLHLRENLGDQELCLAKLASRARMSRFQLIRAFQAETGVTPAKFLFALRMSHAKELLLKTDRSVTDICFDVGYDGLGTFISRFGAAVGLPPNRFRAFCRSRASCLIGIIDRLAVGDAAAKAGLEGRVLAPDGFSGLVFVGWFESSVPESRPVGCAVTTGDGPFVVPEARRGKRRIFALGAPWRDMEGALLHARGVWRARAEIGGSRLEIVLRPPQPLDPPVVVCLPALLGCEGPGLGAAGHPVQPERLGMIG
jgi:AraC family transcriptional regulator